MSKENLTSDEGELTRLRRRVKNQRAELRRFNRMDSAFWKGWQYSNYIQREISYRAKMISFFGLDAVMKAERK